MKKRIYSLFTILFVTVFLFQIAATPAITTGKEYYLYHLYYDKVLGQKSDGTTPGLSQLGLNTNANSYLFVVEASGTTGYYLLRQKSSGKYLAASSSNSYNVQLLAKPATLSNKFLWALAPGLQGFISNQSSPTKYLGCDTGKNNDSYISIFYDKALDELSRWQILEAESGFENGRKQLYINELARLIREGNTLYSQTTYSVTWRAQVNTAVKTAENIYNNATQKTLAEVIEGTQALQKVVEDCRVSDATMLLSKQDFDMDDAYTLSLSEVQFTNDKDSISMVIRNKKGFGAIIELSQNSLSIGNKNLSQDLMDDGTAHSYQFAFNGSSIQIYKDGTPMGSAATSEIPAMTSNGNESEWSLLRSSCLTGYLPEIVSASKSVAPGTSITDKYNNKVRYAVFLKKQNLTLSEPVDFHIMQENAPVSGSKIDLTHEKAWVIFDNTLPSKVVSNYLSSFTINGQQAVINQNVRIAVYLNGAVVIPHGDSVTPFTGYSGETYAGKATTLRLGTNELGTASNSFQSFILKRGYMATLASGPNGSGYSRVYVADHQDLMIPVLPKALNQRISSVHIKKWNYVSKKGWCSTNGNSSIANECNKTRSTWFYTWSADRASTYDTEYIPIRQHLYWPSISQINGQVQSTHVLSFNEPEHAEQHTSDKCSCGGVISPWTACTKTPDLQSSGMRIGSPAPTDASWLNEYIGHCNDMSYRCDFVVMHCYWGTNEAANAAAWYNRLKTIYNNTKRPIWITEWNNGASWTTESWPSSYGEKLEKNKNAIKEILNVLDTCRFIERYSIYNWDTYYRAMIADDGWVTPAGEVYRDNKSTFAYNAEVQFTPIWWTPSLKEVEMKTQINAASNKSVFTIKNPNGDMTDRMVIQRKKADGTFENYYEETDRSVFDQTEYTYSFDRNSTDTEEDEFRLYVTTTAGGETYSNLCSMAYLVNPNIVTNSTSQVDGWTCQRSATNGYTKATGDTYFEAWNSTAKDMHFDYYQDVSNLANGVYELSAACFNSTNGEEGAYVNGHVGLYAQTDGIEYFAPVTTDGNLDPNNRQTIPYIVVTDGKMRIGIKNIGAMSARWAGADEFKLRYLGNTDEILGKQYEAFKEDIQSESDARYTALFTWNATQTEADASGVIINPDCNRKDNYGWTVSNAEYDTKEAFDGNGSNNYWNKWSGSAFSSEMYQDFNYLPTGLYTASALLRCSSGLPMELYVSLDEGVTKKSQSVTGTGNTSSAGSAYQKGWQKVTSPSIVLRRGQSLRIGFTATDEKGNNWWSADHYTLTYKPIDLSSISQIEEGILSIRGEKEGLNCTTSTPTEVSIYTASGILIRKVNLNTGTTLIPLPQGIYIVNQKKIIVP